jgi:phage tail P2-like protein
MTINPSLLPPNASKLERALEAATARVGDVPVPLSELWDPAACPIDLLPWLAWGLSADVWDAAWPEAVKRNAVATSIAQHRIKGTPAAVKTVLARFDALLELVEWWQSGGTPHTFEVRLPLNADGGTRATAAFAEAIIRDVTRVKPVRAHFELVQQITASAAIGIVGVARAVSMLRLQRAGGPNTDPAWLNFLQTEEGEPFENEGGAPGDYLEEK